jgi:hypothetical protein
MTMKNTTKSAIARISLLAASSGAFAAGGGVVRRCNSYGYCASSRLRFDTLGKLDRDALQDALAIIRMFKQHLRLHYHLD